MEALSICAFIFSVLAFVLSLINYISNEATKKSTHQVQFVPADKQPSLSYDNEGFEVMDDKTKMSLENDDIDFDPLFDDNAASSLRPEFLKKKARGV